MLQTQAIEPGSLSVLNRLMKLPEINHLNLVGGTALALKYGHRISEDLDLFSHTNFDANKIITILKKQFGNDLSIEKSKGNWAVFCYIDGIKVDIIHYKHPLLSPIEQIEGIRMYHDHDLMAMKINAIMGRGTRKDFYDICELLHHYPLSVMIDNYYNKYPNQSILISVPSALIYFADADVTLDPASLQELTWSGVKAFIKNKVDEYLRE